MSDATNLLAAGARAMESTHALAAEVTAERCHSIDKHGENSMEFLDAEHPRWLAILGEEYGEVCETLNYDKDSAGLRDELIDLIAVASSWVAALDRASASE